jgi:Prp8 binding protein
MNNFFKYLYSVLWDVNNGCTNYNVLTGHKSAVLQVKWGASSILSCSADKTVAIWDPLKGVRTRKLAEHTSIVNGCDLASDDPNIVASASDDCSVIIWVRFLLY